MKPQSRTSGEKIAHIIQGYADSYKSMEKISADGKVLCGSVAIDLERNVIPQVLEALSETRAIPDPLTLELAEELFGCFLHDAGDYEYGCGVCEKLIPVDAWVTAEHADGCAVAKARDYLAVHKPECTPGYVKLAERPGST